MHRNISARNTLAGVARRLRSQIVGLFMHDDAVTDNRIRPVETDVRIDGLESGIARRIRRDVSKITRVTLR